MEWSKHLSESLEIKSRQYLRLQWGSWGVCKTDFQENEFLTKPGLLKIALAQWQ